MWSRCDKCGEDGVLYNADQRCEVCCFCGVVSESSSLVAGLDVACNESIGTFCDATTTTKFHNKGRGFQRNLSTSTSNLKTSKTGKSGLDCLDHIMTAYGLSAATQEQAHQLYKDSFLKRYQFKDARALAGAVIITVLRRERRVVTFKEVAEYCDAPMKSVGKQFKLVTRILLEKGDVTPPQPTTSESIMNAINFFLSKIPAARALNVSQITDRAREIADWIDACTNIQKTPPHLFALSVCFIAFKMVNLEEYYNLTFQEFNEKFELVPERLLHVSSFQKISPNAIVQIICEVVNKKAGPALRLTPGTVYFLLDIILDLKPLIANPVTEAMMSMDGDAAYEDFKKVKEAQELKEIRDANSQPIDVEIADGEIEEYILSDKEIDLRRAILRDKLEEVSRNRTKLGT